jgi:HPt (histidine-containing phosphotransfer) domain-containing protein
MEKNREDHTIKGLFRYILDNFPYSFQTIKNLFASGKPPAPPDGGHRPEADREPDFDDLDRTLSSELFARLLLELPAHRRRFAAAYRSGDTAQLGRHVHQLLGCAAYCDTPELVDGLQELRRALKTADRRLIDVQYARAIDAIDSILRYSGYTGGASPDGNR